MVMMIMTMMRMMMMRMMMVTVGFSVTLFGMVWQC